MCKSAPRSRQDNHTSTPWLSFFAGRMPFLPPNQQRQSTEGKLCITTENFTTCFINIVQKTTAVAFSNNSAVYMTLPAFAAAVPTLPSDGACYRSISRAHRALSSKPTAPAAEWWDRQTCRRTLNRIIHPAPHTIQASVNNLTNTIKIK